MYAGHTAVVESTHPPRCAMFSNAAIFVASGSYIRMYVQGKLPWQGLTAKTREAHMEKIRKSKTEEVRVRAVPESFWEGDKAWKFQFLILNGKVCSTYHFFSKDIIDFFSFFFFLSQN